MPDHMNSGGFKGGLPPGRKVIDVGGCSGNSRESEKIRPAWRNYLSLQRVVVLVFLLGVYAWSACGTNLSTTELVQGYPHMMDFFSRLFPPNLAIIPELIPPTIETIQVAIWGTTLAVLLAVPLGILAAANLNPHPVLYTGARTILNALRAVSEMVFGLIFVAAVGLGPFPGVLALAFHSAGMLGKFYAEAIESIDTGPVEALEATGAHKLQVIIYGIIPQVLPEFIGYNLYRWEHNVRAATVLGLVGAGGIGFELVTSMRLFKYSDTASILLVILFTVTVVDYISSRIRARVI
jgi:phosphonate transport system permease protein